VNLPANQPGPRWRRKLSEKCHGTVAVPVDFSGSG
jgi:hypothetical protein